MKIEIKLILIFETFKLTFCVTLNHQLPDNNNTQHTPLYIPIYINILNTLALGNYEYKIHRS